MKVNMVVSEDATMIKISFNCSVSYDKFDHVNIGSARRGATM